MTGSIVDVAGEPMEGSGRIAVMSCPWTMLKWRSGTGLMTWRPGLAGVEDDADAGFRDGAAADDGQRRPRN